MVEALPTGFLSTGSAWREITVVEALARARAAAPQVGITRVTDITRLDRIGVPVAVGIRPNAMPGSLCVTAGKGLTLNDALVGATMEGIEMAFSEPARGRVKVVMATARHVLDGQTRREAITDFCLPWGTMVNLDAAFPCAWAEDIATGEKVLVPAESVFYPMPHPLGKLGTSTNGLASGSSVTEATLHALAEVIERDAYSFHRLQNPPLIDSATLPEPLAGIDRRLTDQGFDTWYFYMVNPFGVPAIATSIYDLHDRRFLTSGQGCHLSPTIAAVRALTEAIQSRGSIIHGGRDDLVVILNNHPARPWEQMDEIYRSAKAALAAGAPAVPFDGIPDASAEAPTIPSAIALLRARLAAQGFHRVLRVVLTPSDFPVQVVRVIVPGLERHAADSNRIGPRLRKFFKGQLTYP
jgi:ribosomal protein S12 methylthiotransferase accessory factor